MTDEAQDPIQPETPPENTAAAAAVTPAEDAGVDEPVAAPETAEPSMADTPTADTEQPNVTDSAAADEAADEAAPTGFTSTDADHSARPSVLGSPVEGIAASDAVPHSPPNFTAADRARELAEINLLDDVELDVKIELGRTQMYIEDVLRLHAGSVVELDKLAGDPVDIFVNERLVAHGEVLVLNDNFCVRVNDIISPIPVVDETT